MTPHRNPIPVVAEELVRSFGEDMMRHVPSVFGSNPNAKLAFVFSAEMTDNGQSLALPVRGLNRISWDREELGGVIQRLKQGSSPPAGRDEYVHGLTTAQETLPQLNSKMAGKILEEIEGDPDLSIELDVHVKMNSNGRNVDLRNYTNHVTLILHLEDLEDLMPQLRERAAEETSPV